MTYVVLAMKGKRVTFNGGADRDRTDDLRLAKPALSQLSYSPTENLDRLLALFAAAISLEGEQDG